MINVLNVAEKPSAAKKLASILSNNTSRFRRGLSQYNGIYEFPYNLQGHGQVHMIFTSVTGHLLETDFPDQYRKWHSIDAGELIERNIPVIKKVPERSENIYRQLQIESRKCGLLVLWLDGDLEGENISFEVIETCKEVNNRLNIERGTIKRAKFSEITPRAIGECMRRLVIPNQLESDAVDARQEIDLRTGAAFTRLQTSKLSRSFVLPHNSGDKTLLSFGTCQFPTLGFIVERYLENKNFVPESFWKIEVLYENKGMKAQFWWDRYRLFDQVVCLAIYERILRISTYCEVTSVNSYPKTKYKPFPLNTIELQKLGTRVLRISGHEIMNIAEKLYNDGLISYPRTETNLYKLNDNELRGIIQEQVRNNTWGGYANNLLNAGKYERPRRGNSDDNAHPPIHPVRTPGQNELNPIEKRLYELIAKHFLACVSKNAFGQETKVTIQIADELFHCKGLMILERNYLEIFNYEYWSKKEIPVFKKGDRFTAKSIYMKDYKTIAPSLLKERDLISLMDKNGIGTDATIAQHIEKIQKRGYCRKEGEYFRPTNMGLSLVEGYNDMRLFLAKPELRKKMEEDMKKIVSGQIGKDEMLIQNLKMYKNVFVEVEKKFDILTRSFEKYFPTLNARATVLTGNISQCGKCQQRMDLKKNGNYNMLYCGNCKESLSMPTNGTFSGSNEKCPICNFEPIKVVTEKGSHFLCPNCFNNPPSDIENAGEFKFRCFMCTHITCKLATGRVVGKCPNQQCNGNLAIKKMKEKQKWFVGCSNYPRCKTGIWFDSNCVGCKLSNKCNQCSMNGSDVLMVDYSYNDMNNSRIDKTICLFCAQPGILNELNIQKNIKNVLENIPPSSSNRSNAKKRSRDGNSSNVNKKKRKKSQNQNNNRRQNNRIPQNQYNNNRGNNYGNNFQNKSNYQNNRYRNNNNNNQGGGGYNSNTNNRNFNNLSNNNNNRGNRNRNRQSYQRNNNRNYNNNKYGLGKKQKCKKCKMECVVKISKTNKNPDRPFFKCSNSCGFQGWVE